MKKYKRLILILCSGLLLFSISACGVNDEGSSKSTSSNSSGSEEEAVVLRISWFGAQYRHDATLKALEAYTQKYPNVTFEPEFVGTNPAYIEKIAIQAAAKNLSDIVTMDAPWIAEYAGRGRLAELDSGIETADIDENILNEGKYDGKLYALSNSTNAIGLIYNKDKMIKAGIPLPKPGWTWDEFYQYGIDNQSKLGSNEYALFDPSDSYTVYNIYQVSQGKGDAITVDGEINFDRETWLTFMDKFAELREAGIVPPADVTASNKDVDVALDTVLNGTTLMKMGFTSWIGGYNSVHPGSYDIAEYPRGIQSGTHLKVSGLWAVASNTEYLEEAKAVVNYLVNDLEAGSLLGTVRGFPANNKVNEFIAPSYDSDDKLGAAYIKAVAPDAAPFANKAPGWNPFYLKDYKEVAQLVIFGKLTLEEGYEELMKKAEYYVNN